MHRPRRRIWRTRGRGGDECNGRTLAFEADEVNRADIRAAHENSSHIYIAPIFTRQLLSISHGRATSTRYDDLRSTIAVPDSRSRSRLSASVSNRSRKRSPFHGREQRDRSSTHFSLLLLFLFPSSPPLTFFSIGRSTIRHARQPFEREICRHMSTECMVYATPPSTAESALRSKSSC